MEGTADVSQMVKTGIELGLNAGSTVLNFIVENPYLSAFFFVGFIGLGIGIVKKLKH